MPHVSVRRVQKFLSDASNLRWTRKLRALNPIARHKFERYKWAAKHLKAGSSFWKRIRWFSERQRGMAGWWFGVHSVHLENANSSWLMGTWTPKVTSKFWTVALSPSSNCIKLLMAPFSRIMRHVTERKWQKMVPGQWHRGYAVTRAKPGHEPNWKLVGTPRSRGLCRWKAIWLPWRIEWDHKFRLGCNSARHAA